MIGFLMFEPQRERAEAVRLELKAFFLQEKRSFELTTLFQCQDVLNALINHFPKYDIVLISLDDEEEAAKIAEAVRRRSMVTAIVFLGEDYGKLSRLLPWRPSAMLSQISENAFFLGMISKLYMEQSKYKQRKNNRCFLVRNRDELERIPYEHIDFFESSNRKVRLHTNQSKRVYEFTAKMDEVLAALTTPDFLRCHQSYLVNLANVRRIDKTARRFIMFSGKTADISKRGIGEAAAHFEKYAALR